MSRIMISVGRVHIVLASFVLLIACSDPDQHSVSTEISSGSAVEMTEVQESDTRPNVLLIVADDLGFTDIGSFGSEIPTPNLDELAYAGLRLASLHAGPACQPTRSMLMGSVPESQGIITRPPLEGGERNNLLSLEWPNIAELLQEAGYATYMTGKWDLGWDEGYTPATRGFDRSFVQLNGASSFFAEPLLLVNTTGFEDDGVPLEFSDLAEDFYVTNAYTEKMLGYLESSPEGQPWFAFMPYTAPHWPLQLPEDWLDRYAGRYDAGYDELRVSRVNGATSQGVIPENLTLEGFQPLALAWEELADIEKQQYSRAQEIYAGMIEHLDMSIGRVLDHLRATDQLQNTLVIFTADHGASRGEFGVGVSRYGRGGPQPGAWVDNSLENFGRKNSFIDHGLGFAEAATAPFAQVKGSMNEGGLRAAAFVYYPKEISAGGISHSFMTMMDILPTIMQATETELPEGSFRGREIQSIRGVSAWSHLTGIADRVHIETTAGWSSGRGSALIKGDYKILGSSSPNQEAGIEWQLFNIVEDAGERNDLAEEYPELLAEMVAEWEANWQ